MLQCMLCLVMQFPCSIKKETFLRQAKQTIRIKQIKTTKKINPPPQLLPFADKISISESTATDLYMICSKIFFFQWVVDALLLDKIMVPCYYRKCVALLLLYFFERLKAWRQEPKSINNENTSSSVCSSRNSINKAWNQWLTCSNWTVPVIVSLVISKNQNKEVLGNLANYLN